MRNDLFLKSDVAKNLYDAVRDLPIVDYHCHLSPKEILEDREFPDIAQIWLGSDHYKWRLMRACGVPEALITGNAEPREKFRAWAACLETAMGNPLYVWSHMELSMFFRKFLASAGTDSRKCGCTSRMFCGMFLSVSIGVAPICTVATEAPQAIMM